MNCEQPFVAEGVLCSPCQSGGVNTQLYEHNNSRKKDFNIIAARSKHLGGVRILVTSISRSRSEVKFSENLVNTKLKKNVHRCICQEAEGSHWHLPVFLFWNSSDWLPVGGERLEQHVSGIAAFTARGTWLKVE